MKTTVIKPRIYLSVVSTIALLGLAACGAQETGTGGRGIGDLGAAQGDPFSLMGMAHTSEVENPSHQVEGPPIKTTPWDGRQEGGPFSYSSIRCRDRAPVNDIATNLITYNSRLPNSNSPASMRMQPLQFRVEQGGRSGEISGTMTLVACGLSGGAGLDLDENVTDEQRDKITFRWEAEYETTSEQEVVWQGTFTIRGGTGQYEGIEGSGQISGYFFCFGGCEQDQPFQDTQFVMLGNYEPTAIPTASPTQSPAATGSPAGSPTTGAGNTATPAGRATGSPAGSPTPSPAESPTPSPQEPTGSPAESPAG